MTNKDIPSITCPKCNRTSYCEGDIVYKFCGKCGFHANLLNVTRGEAKKGGKTDLLEFIKNKDLLAEPLMMNFAKLTDAEIAQRYAPFWIRQVSKDSELTPLANAKKYGIPLSIMRDSDNCQINELIEFCYPDDPPQKPQFGIAQAGGLVVIYPHDIVWFYEPDGSQCWARMD